MPIKLVVTDFDGTMTDAEAEGLPFIESYTEMLLHLTGLDTGTFYALFDGMSQQIHEHPHKHGVKKGGIMVAPAIVDPYLRMQTIAGMIFDREGLFTDSRDRANLLEMMFRASYAKTDVVPRLGAVELLTALTQSSDLDTCIVTNARTKSVQHKLEVMGMNSGSIPLCANAQKFFIGDDPARIPERIQLLEETDDHRWIYPRRSKYYELLNFLRRQNELDWSEICVIGDIFELDLALPFLLGCEVILIVNDMTPGYEIDWLSRLTDARARIFGDLNDVRGYLLGY